VRGSFGGGVVSTGLIDPTYGVLVDGVGVYAGEPRFCEDLQRRIDEARTSRCLSLYGRLVPYRPETPEEAVGSGIAVSAVTARSAVPTSAAAASSETGFVLFLAGEPFRDVIPGGGRQTVLGVSVAGGPGPVEVLGGHEPADFQPGQLYGSQAEMGRMVLDLANKCGVPVRVVDVEHPGAEAELVQRSLPVAGPLPVLLRPDGARLAGSESFVPRTVAAFLQGR